MVMTLLITVCVLAGLAIAYQGYWLRRTRLLAADLVDEGRNLREQLQQLEQEIGALCSASMGAGEHVVRLEQQVQRIVERQNRQDMQTAVERPYSQASQLVTHGADIDELMQTCGLTRGEAELLIMMQRAS